MVPSNLENEDEPVPLKPSEFLSLVGDIIRSSPSEEKSDVYQFINSPDPNVLFVAKRTDDLFVTFEDFSELSSLSSTVSLSMIIKLKGALHNKIPLDQQLNVLTIPIIDVNDHPDSETDFIEKLRVLIKMGLSPFFDFATHNTTSKETSNASAVKKRFNELSLSLQHLQQRIQVPDILGSIHPRVKEIKGKIDDDVLKDYAFLNELTSLVNNWTRQCQSVTSLTHNPKDGNSLREEILFWRSMETALQDLGHQLSDEDVKTSVEVLDKAKRFHITLSFRNDIGLNEKVAFTNICNSILKDLPYDELNTITSSDEDALQKMNNAVSQIFHHLRRFKTLNLFPLSRAIDTTEMIINDIVEKYIELFSSYSVMHLGMSEFLKVHDLMSLKIIESLDQNVKFITNLFRELLRKRNEKFFVVKINQSLLNKVKETLEYIKSFRIKHHHLQVALNAILGTTEEKELIDVYSNFIAPLNCWDFSKQGKIIWNTNEGHYLSTYQRLEVLLTKKMSNTFDNCVNFNDFISAFNKFDFTNDESDKTLTLMPLVKEEVKLRVLGAVQIEMDETFDDNKGIKSAKKMAVKLYRVHLNDTEDSTFIRIVWKTGLLKKLEFYRNHLKRYLGDNWNKFTIGIAIHTKMTSLFQQLSPSVDFSEWSHELTQMTAGVNFLKGQEPVIKIVQLPSLDLLVNFDWRLFQIAEEVVHLIELGYGIQTNLQLHFKAVLLLRPYVRSIKDYIGTIKRIMSFDLTSADHGLHYGFLANNAVQNVYNVLLELLKTSWQQMSQNVEFEILQNDSKGENLTEVKARDLEESTPLISLQASVVNLYRQNQTIMKLYTVLKNKHYPSLKSCEYQSMSFRSVLEKIEEEILMFRENDSFLALREIIGEEVAQILVSRCFEQISIFSQSVKDSDSGFSLDQCRHEIHIRDQSFTIEPGFATSKSLLIHRVNTVLITIMNQNDFCTEYTFGDRLEKTGAIDELGSLVCDALKNVDSIIEESEAYFSKWVAIQGLWELNLDSENDMELLVPKDSDLILWIEIVNKIRGLRHILDNSEDTKRFGGCISVDATKVTSRSSLKFDNFQQSLAKKFSGVLMEDIRTLNNSLGQIRSSLLEKLSVHSESIQTLEKVDALFYSESNILDWRHKLNLVKQGERILYKLRFKFGSEWIYSDEVENKLQEIRSLVEDKRKTIENNHEVFIQTLKKTATELKNSISDLVESWNEKKPIDGDLTSFSALRTIQSFEKSSKSLSNSSGIVKRVADRLNIHMHIQDSISDVAHDVLEMKSVWQSINTISEAFNEYKGMKWDNIDSSEFRKQLDSLYSKTRNVSLHVKQYRAFKEIQGSIKSHMKSYALVKELKGSSMKNRHWKSLLKQLNRTDLDVSSLTIGEVWELNLELNKGIFKSILEQSYTEEAIEESLNRFKNDWANTAFETFTYENKFRLVRNWNLLLNQCSDHISSLSSMKNSISYGFFMEEINQFEDKLNRIYTLLESWLDVQRHWVYLDGIFGNESANMKKLLPLESSRFTNITYEFMNVLSAVFKLDTVLSVLSIPDVPDIMKRLADSLKKIGKSLIDFLEKQRESFARFYFVGNEDLLELIGSSSHIHRISSHLPKMFGGLSSLDFSDELSAIVAINSPEGEKVLLKNPISLVKYPYLIDWLKELEQEIKNTLSLDTMAAYLSLDEIFGSSTLNNIKRYIEGHSFQAGLLGMQLYFTRNTERAIKGDSLHRHLERYHSIFRLIKEIVISEEVQLLKRKTELLLIEVLHQIKVIETLIKSSSMENSCQIWSMQQLYYYDNSLEESSVRLTVKHSYCSFTYGFEYLGVPDKLAHTPLLDKCYLSMSQAHHQGLGGSLFGPAGTGKTESIKSLGQSLGKMVLVFCCDESFDSESMGRIFLGLCQVGAWGCFDELNRLDEQNLSSVSSLIESVTSSKENDIMKIIGKNVKKRKDMGIFVTMNPGYAGRYELPENLKKQFRSFSMKTPDREIIVETLLTTMAFLNSKEIARIIVPFYLELEEQTSDQRHYDYGLRSVKACIMKCGSRRKRLGQKEINLSTEKQITLTSLDETLSPKLVKGDHDILTKLESRYFQNIHVDYDDFDAFKTELVKHCVDKGLVASSSWLKKAVQLYQLQSSHLGIMLMGDSGSGKSVLWKAVLKIMSNTEKANFVSYVIDSKLMSKEQLYGRLDTVTNEWTDGLLTDIIRRIHRNVRGELSTKTWIVFDGDIDPEWAENLNSCLDDNKTLTLPSGERIGIPENVRILFEADRLDHATMATVSRCGMLWFDSDLVTIKELTSKRIFDLSSILQTDSFQELSLSDSKRNLKALLIESLKEVLSTTLLDKVFNSIQNYRHIMKFDQGRAIHTLFIFIASYFRKFLEENLKNDVTTQEVSNFVGKITLLSIIWAFTGDCPLDSRESFGLEVKSYPEFSCLDEIQDGSYIDYNVSSISGEWMNWNNNVNFYDLEPHEITNPNIFIPTLDTTRHQSLIHALLNEHAFFLLCGPPGSGKTMIFLESLRRAPQLDLLSINFSKETSVNSLMQLLEQHCEYHHSVHGMTLRPKLKGKWVVVFCDEINLPALDKFGTQRVLSLIRQFVEHGGYWNPTTLCWVTLENIQFLGACNSPNDPGRHPITQRLLRQTVLIMVDYPGKESLMQIYSTINKAILKSAPDVRGYRDTLTNASISVYLKTKERLTSSICDHYVYSPRELTRWSRGLFEALKSSTAHTLTDLVKLWYHEGLRLFYDRLVGEDERSWTLSLLQDTIKSFFHVPDVSELLKEPLFYTNWLTSRYEIADKEQLRGFIKERLRVFSDEEENIDLILYEDLIDHALRINRVLRQMQGHMILVGPSGSGKTTLVKFVSWVNGLKFIPLNVHRKFRIQDFEKILRDLLLKCLNGEKICFAIDESCILESSFVERMNTLLANSEVPGLFVGEDFKTLMKVCYEKSQAHGLFLDSDDELYSWFTQQVSVNLHVVFTLTDLKGKNSPQVISSPALFNRCVMNWMGDWSVRSLVSIGNSMVEYIPLDLPSYTRPSEWEYVFGKPNSIREIVVDILVYVHCLPRLSKGNLVKNSPAQYLSLITQFIELFNLKQSELESDQRHTLNGLDKLRETVVQIDNLKRNLSTKRNSLKIKDNEAKDTLSKMLSSQNEAERKQEVSIVAKEELQKQDTEIRIRREKVMEKLALAEPAVLEAQRGVQNIKKQHLTEIRSMFNPPSPVKMTMESVCTLLGYDVSTWRDVQLVIRSDDFIPKIVSFDNEASVNSALKTFMQKQYLSRPDYNFESVDRASKACGPLLNWVTAQLSYAEVLNVIGPLKKEVEYLENRNKKTKAQLIAVDEMIQELEEGIENYKDEYSNLIRQTENIKMEMKRVELKVNKSETLLNDLTEEKDRWKANVKKFSETRNNIIGNSILCSSSLVYFGPYDQKTREILMRLLKERIKCAGIPFDPLLTFDYIGPSDFTWTMRSVSNDDLEFENYNIIKWAKIPFIIDPSSIVLRSFSKFSSDRLIITSFLEVGYLKSVENALKFGGHVVIQDAENYDPVLNPIVRGEISINGGRRVVKLGTSYVDVSKNFKLYFHTKEASIFVPEFMSSRTKVINFSISGKSLEKQIINATVRYLKPDIEQKRIQLASLQSHYRSRLLALERELLGSLGNSPGALLDDAQLLDTLEKLKNESRDIDEKFADSENVLELIERSRNEYFEIAKQGRDIFKILEYLPKIDALYFQPIESFLNLFNNLLQSFEGQFSNDLLIESFYKEVFADVSSSLKFVDRFTLATCLTLNLTASKEGPHIIGAFIEIFKSVISGTYNNIQEALKMLNVTMTPSNDFSLSGLNLILDQNHDNKDLLKISDILRALTNNHLEVSFKEEMNRQSSFLYSGIGPYSTKYDLEYWASKPGSSSKPILLASPNGYDATSKVDQVARKMKKDLTVVSLGSGKELEYLNEIAESAMLEGNWILAQNIQLSGDSLEFIFKKLDSVDSSSEFRIFFTSNTAETIPSNIIRRSKVILFENQPSLKSKLMDAFQIVTDVCGYGNTSELHSCFIVSWFHATIEERLRYAPFSFSKRYDINDSDLISASTILKELTFLSKGLVPWRILGYLVGDIVYGGKIDIKQDAVYVTKLAESLFSIHSTQEEFNLISNHITKVTGEILSIPPSDSSRDEYVEWILQLPDDAPLSYVGLEEDVKESIQQKEIRQSTQKVLNYYLN